MRSPVIWGRTARTHGTTGNSSLPIRRSAQPQYNLETNARPRAGPGEWFRSGAILTDSSRTVKMPIQPDRQLETFENANPERDYLIHMEIPEFTCLCPKTGQPDFATLFLDYIPDRRCVELKSLKLYIWSYRNEGTFHEAVTNRILNDIAAATSPRYIRLTAKFYVRGGIYTTVVAEHRQPGWQPAPPVDLAGLTPLPAAC